MPGRYDTPTHQLQITHYTHHQPELKRSFNKGIPLPEGSFSNPGSPPDSRGLSLLLFNFHISVYVPSVYLSGGALRSLLAEQDFLQSWRIALKQSKQLISLSLFFKDEFQDESPSEHIGAESLRKSHDTEWQSDHGLPVFGVPLQPFRTKARSPP